MRLAVGRDAPRLTRVLGYRSVKWLIKYFEKPLGAKIKMWQLKILYWRGLKGDWQDERETFYLKKGDTLMKNTITNILSIYYLSILTIPTSVVKRLKSIRCRFL